MGDHRSALGRLPGAAAASTATSMRATIPTDSVVGRAFVLFWPLEPGRLAAVPDTFDQVPSRAQ